MCLATGVNLHIVCPDVLQVEELIRDVADREQMMKEQEQEHVEVRYSCQGFCSCDPCTVTLKRPPRPPCLFLLQPT